MSSRNQELLSAVQDAHSDQDMQKLRQYADMSNPKVVYRKARKSLKRLRAGRRPTQRARYVRAHFSRN